MLCVSGHSLFQQPCTQSEHFCPVLYHSADEVFLRLLAVVPFTSLSFRRATGSFLSWVTESFFSDH